MYGRQTIFSLPQSLLFVSFFITREIVGIRYHRCVRFLLQFRYLIVFNITKQNVYVCVCMIVGIKCFPSSRIRFYSDGI